MKPEDLYSDIQNYCLKNRKEENIKKYSRYFKEGYTGYGVNLQDLRSKVKELKKNRDITIDLVCEAAPALIKSSMYEEPAFALLLLNEYKKEYTEGTFDLIETWYSEGIHNWAHADTLGMYILPEFILKDIIHIERFKPWLKAQNSFQRRSVPVTLIKAVKKRKYDFHWVFGFLEPLMTDPAREVHQGMGWFLREAWKLDHETTEDFLMRWKNISPRLIFQYACEKMTKEERLRFKREKT